MDIANLRFELARDVIFRLSASRDYARPGLADIRNYVTTSLDANGNVTSTAGNPFLRPIIADNADATLEWYFAGSHLGSMCKWQTFGARWLRRSFMAGWQS